MCSKTLPLLVLDLGLDIVDGVRRLDFESDGFTREADIGENVRYSNRK